MSIEKFDHELFERQMLTTRHQQQFDTIDIKHLIPGENSLKGVVAVISLSSAPKQTKLVLTPRGKILKDIGYVILGLCFYGSIVLAAGLLEAAPL